MQSRWRACYVLGVFLNARSLFGVVNLMMVGMMKST